MYTSRARAHNLQLDNLALELHSPDFLHSAILQVSSGHVQSIGKPIARKVSSGRRADQSWLGTHEVHSDRADVALRVGVILHIVTSIRCIVRACSLECLKGSDCSCQERQASTELASTPWPATSRTRTANRSSKHDLPTPESPISRSCTGTCV